MYLFIHISPDKQTSVYIYIHIYLFIYIYVCIQREIYFKELWRLTSPKSAWQASRLKTQGRVTVIVQVQMLSAGNIPRSGEVSVVLLRPSTDWTRPIHTMEGNLLYSKPTDLNINHIQETLTQKHPKDVDQISWHRGPAKLTHKVNLTGSGQQISPLIYRIKIRQRGFYGVYNIVQ